MLTEQKKIEKEAKEKYDKFFRIKPKGYKNIPQKGIEEKSI